MNEEIKKEIILLLLTVIKKESLLLFRTEQHLVGLPYNLLHGLTTQPAPLLIVTKTLLLFLFSYK
ncbi:hypothetical protein SDC9_193272 [bioreactor metagenome]|uniref:Uncharacterized protein n=1 Tax=bioreactor metagenome TaxID=1076179 RepID=A0A645IE73_9ZZZZ